MSRYRQQVKRALRDRDMARDTGRAEPLGPLRQVRVGEKLPPDARVGEVFEVLRDVDGTWLPVARVRVLQGLTGLGVRVIS